MTSNINEYLDTVLTKKKKKVLKQIIKNLCSSNNSIEVEIKQQCGKGILIMYLTYN